MGCDDHYCFVVFGDEENCLDPEAELKVYSPNVLLFTGTAFKLRLFMNRAHQPAHYVWSIKQRPNGSNATISNPIGNTATSSIFEYILEKHPVFVPDEPGRYVLQINVEALFEDAQTHMIESSDLHEVEIIVTGPSLNRHTGCSVAPDQSNIFLLLMLAGYLGIRKRN